MQDNLLVKKSPVVSRSWIITYVFKVLKNQFNNAQNKVSLLFKQLTTEATRLEKLKANFGAGGGSLHAFLQVI